jgi:hypothetical protein
MILRHRVGGKRRPLLRALGWHNHPLAKDLTATRGIEEMRSRDGESTGVGRGISELEHHSRAREAKHDPARALHARHPEYLRCATVGMPHRDRIDDIGVLIVGTHVWTIRRS